MVLGQLVLVLEVLRVQRWQPHSGPSFCGCLGLQVGDRELYGGLALHVERAQEEREEDEAGDAEHEVAAGEKAEAQEGGVGPCGEAARVLAGRREHGGGGGDGGEREDGEGAPGGFEAGVLHWQGRSRSLMVFSSNAQRGAEPPKGALDTRKGLCSHGESAVALLPVRRPEQSWYLTSTLSSLRHCTHVSVGPALQDEATRNAPWRVGLSI